MTWSYSGNPATNKLDMVRFLIGDTDENDPQLGDAEITSVLELNGNEPYASALACAEALVAKYSRLTQKSIGGLSISYNQRIDHYRELIKQLRRRAALAGAGGTPWTAAVSVSEKRANTTDADVVQPYFRVGMHDSKD